MIVLNAFKLLFSNFGLMWRLLLYYLIVTAIAAAFFMGVIYPQISDLLTQVAGTQVFENFKVLIGNLVTMSPDLMQSSETFRVSLGAAADVIAQNSGSLILPLILVGVMIILVRFLYGLGDYPAFRILNGSLKERARYPFWGTLITNLPKSMLTSLCVMLITLPTDILFCLLIYWLAGWSVSVFGIFALFVVAGEAILLFSVRETFLAAWRPLIASENKNPVRAFGESLSLCGKSFFFVFSQQVILLFLLILLNLISAFFTCGAGILLSLPASLEISFLFQILMLFAFRHSRFYVDSQNVGRMTVEKASYDIDEMILEEKEKDSEENKF